MVMNVLKETFLGMYQHQEHTQERKIYLLWLELDVSLDLRLDLEQNLCQNKQGQAMLQYMVNVQIIIDVPHTVDIFCHFLPLKKTKT